MSKQTALEYAEAKLAEAKAEYSKLESAYGEDLHDFDICDDADNFDESYELGTEHGATFRDLQVLPEIIALLKKERE